MSYDLCYCRGDSRFVYFSILGLFYLVCIPLQSAGRFEARNSYYRLYAAIITSAAMRRGIETPRDTNQ